MTIGAVGGVESSGEENAADTPEAVLVLAGMAVIGRAINPVVPGI